MRLLLDAHVSARRVAGALRERGHDVRSADEERFLAAAPDHELLALAAAEERIMVTFDVRDFVVLAKEWAEGSRHHAGIAILVGIDHAEFGLIARRLEEALAQRPDPAGWQDLVHFVSR